MTYFTHIRAGLISSVLLLSTALASPALANTLPEISPRQIASDVEVKYNPETGAREYIAPSFDPFEEDRSMAGTASLRSVSNATAIDGQTVRGGALLDMTFYYNSASNDPYDTRGYTDAVYLSGEYAPVTLRDNRILECNEQVQDVVYYHEDYYRPSLYINLFRPYRHYAGHYRYDRFRDRGYAYGRGYSGHRGYGSGIRGNNRTRDRRGLAERIADRVREDNGQSRRSRDERLDRGERRDRSTRRSEDSTRRGERVNENRARVTPRNERAARGRNMDRTPSAHTENRNTRERANRTNSGRAEIRRGGRDGFMGGPRRLENETARTSRQSQPRRTENRAAPRSTPRTTSRTERAPSPERASRSRSGGIAGRVGRQVETRSAPRSAPAPRVAAPAPRAAAPAPRPKRAERSKPARAERAVSRVRETKSRSAPRRSGGSKTISRGNAKLKLMNFLPMASSWSRNVVRNVDTQCAREEMLTVHIPQERLDAARFDGLTVLVLDRAGEEIPVYVPANYIEGFRQAVNGRTAPSVSYQEPLPSETVTRGPVYQEPRPYSIESAPCPVGTTKQDDGTCLQGGGAVTYGGYPTR